MYFPIFPKRKPEVPFVRYSMQHGATQRPSLVNHVFVLESEKNGCQILFFCCGDTTGPASKMKMSVEISGKKALGWNIFDWIVALARLILEPLWSLILRTERIVLFNEGPKVFETVKTSNRGYFRILLVPLRIELSPRVGKKLPLQIESGSRISLRTVRTARARGTSRRPRRPRRA